MTPIAMTPIAMTPIAMTQRRNAPAAPMPRATLSAKPLKGLRYAEGVRPPSSAPPRGFSDRWRWRDEEREPSSVARRGTGGRSRFDRARRPGLATARPTTERSVRRARRGVDAVFALAVVASSALGAALGAALALLAVDYGPTFWREAAAPDAEPMLFVSAAVDDPAAAPNEAAASDVSPNPPTTVRPPWRRYAVAPPAAALDRPALAIVIDDLGAHPARDDAVLATPAPITVAVLPHAENAQALADRARSVGKETLLHLPMEPVGPQDPGPGAILTTASPAENAARLAAALDAFEGYVGVNNHMGSAATARPALMTPLLATLEARGLMFLDSSTTPDSVGWRLARHGETPAAVNHLFLDAVRDEATILKQLDAAAERARRVGTTVAIGHPYPETIAALSAWLANGGPDGLALVPITEAATRLSGLSEPAAPSSPSTPQLPVDERGAP